MAVILVLPLYKRKRIGMAVVPVAAELMYNATRVRYIAAWSVPLHLRFRYGTPVRPPASTVRFFVFPLVVRLRSLYIVHVVPFDFSQLMLFAVINIWLLVFTWIVLKRLLPTLKRKVFVVAKVPNVRSPSTVRAFVLTLPENVPMLAFKFPDALILLVAMPRLSTDRNI